MRTRRAVVIGLGIGLVVVVVAGAVVVFAFRDRATSISADDAAAGLTIPGPGERPGDPGLYVFETVGFETTDALLGARHEYPAETFLTIQPGGCGVLVKWHALDQRWTEWDYCPEGSLAGWNSYHEWFNVSNLDEWVCDPPVQASGAAGEEWSAACTKGDTSQTADHAVIGVETLDIGGEPVETLHVRTSSVLTGRTEGGATTDIWTLPGTHLVVQRTVDSSSVSESAIGPVAYHEEYRVRLTSLYPSSP